jgi:GTP cyclohydrolase II
MATVRMVVSRSERLSSLKRREWNSYERTSAADIAAATPSFTSSVTKMNFWSTRLLNHGHHSEAQRRASTYNEDVTPDSVRKLAVADFPTRWGHFRILGFGGKVGVDRRTEEAVALVLGEVSDPQATPLVRIHSQCLTGDVFGSLRCDCRQQLEMALTLIASAGCGILIYDQKEGRGIGLMAKLQAYSLQDQGLDTVEANEKLGFKADHREFELPALILQQLGVKNIRLLSNNPQKVSAMEEAGIKVVERVSAEVEPHAESAKYMKTKQEKMGHLFGKAGK